MTYSVVDYVRPRIEAVFHNYSDLHKAVRANWSIERCKEIISKNGQLRCNI